jgi:SAM-dependent methyltransferase
VLHGHTLDLGGGRRAGYRDLLRINGFLDAVNIDLKFQPSVCADANAPWPFQSSAFDNLLSLNTFEHLTNDYFALREAIRVLKPGGQFHAVIPFLYRVHSPSNDYHRHTGYWWRDTMLACGLNAESLTIEPLVWDTVVSAYSLIEPSFGRLTAVSKRLALLIGVIIQSRWPGTRMPAVHPSRYQDFALGYYVHGHKALPAQ